MLQQQSSLIGYVLALAMPCYACVYWRDGRRLGLLRYISVQLSIESTTREFSSSSALGVLSRFCVFHQESLAHNVSLNRDNNWVSKW